MEYKINDISTTEKEIELSLTYDEIKQELEEKVKERIKKIEMPGFRKGKVPLPMVKKMYGNELEYDASEKIAQKQFFDIMKSNDINYYGTPAMIDLKYNPNESLTCKVSYEVMPILEIDNYKNLDIKVQKFPENPNEVQSEIDFQLNKKRTLEDVDVVGEDNNYVVSIEAFVRNSEGVIPEDAKPLTFDVDMNVESINLDLQSKLKGTKSGDTFDFEAEDYEEKEPSEVVEKEEERKLKKVTYFVKVLTIKKIILPELNEVLIKKLSKGKAENIEEYKKLISDDINEYRNNIMNNLIDHMVEKKILESIEVPLPKSYVEKYISEVTESEFKHQQSHSHSEHDHSHIHKSKDDIRKEVEKTAENDLKWLIIKEEIISREKIEASEEDKLAFAEKEASRYGLDAQKFLELYGNSFTRTIQNDKFMKFLKENNNIIYDEAEVSANE